MNYTVVDASTILATHLTEMIRSYAHELLGRQEVKTLIDHVGETHPKLIEELVPSTLSVGEIQKVLQSLLREKVSIRDLVTIFESLADYGGRTKDPVTLTEAAPGDAESIDHKAPPERHRRASGHFTVAGVGGPTQRREDRRRRRSVPDVGFERI